MNSMRFLGEDYGGEKYDSSGMTDFGTVLLIF